VYEGKGKSGALHPVLFIHYSLRFFVFANLSSTEIEYLLFCFNFLFIIRTELIIHLLLNYLLVHMIFALKSYVSMVGHVVTLQSFA
jgi:hypothetical protein